MSLEVLLLERLLQLPDVTIVSPTTPYRRGRARGIEPVEWGVSVRLSSCHVVFSFDRLGDAHRDLPFTLWFDKPVCVLELPGGDIALSTGNSVVIVHPLGRHLPPEGFTVRRDICDILGQAGLSAVLAVEFSTNMDLPEDPWHPIGEDDLELFGIRSVRVGRPSEASMDAREVRLTLVGVSAVEKKRRDAACAFR